MIFIYIFAVFALIRIAILLRDLHTGRYLRYHHEFDHGYSMAQGMYNSITGKYELRVILQKEIEQRRFTKHWYGAACWLADAEGQSWPKPWGDHYANKFWRFAGNCTELALHGIDWLMEHPIIAAALVAAGILIGVVAI